MVELALGFKMLSFLLQPINIILICHFYKLTSDIPSEALVAIPQIILALIVALAFFVIDKANDSIDREIIIKKVLLAPQLFKIITIGSLSLLFVDNKNLKILPFAYNITLILYAAIILRHFFRWLSLSAEVNHKLTYRQRLRIDFCSSQKSDQDFLMVWNLILSDKNLKDKNQSGLINAFIDAANKIKNQDKYQYNYNQFIWQLISNLHKINFYNPDDYRILVKYSLIFFKDYHNKAKNSTIKPSSHAKRALFLALLDKATDIDNDDNEIFEQIIFEEINIYIENGDFTGKDIIWTLLHRLYERCLSEKIHLHELWENHKIFNRWTITSWESKKLNDEQKTILNTYSDIIFNKILEKNLAEQGIDLLGDLTNCIFPGVDLRVWFVLYTFSLKVTYDTHNDIIKTKQFIRQWSKITEKFTSIKWSNRSFVVSHKGKSKKNFWEELLKQAKEREEQEQKHTFEILFNLNILPKIPDIFLMGIVISTITEMIDEYKIKADTPNEEYFLSALEELRSILDAFKKFIETQSISQ